MATAPRVISVEEYLHTAYHPDRDYVDGAVLSATWASTTTPDYKL